ncbi:hypothetical protein WMF26_26525 [Sorangium sp. So ce185]|uniref:hypothetical protein n=1 Tax=Sorangium sp. So ce185 TaxID=3133287 RepID=UPI003F6454BA
MSDIELLLCHADDQRPVLEEGLPLESAADEPQPGGEELIHDFADFSDDPNDLSLQRWSVIAPEGPAGDALLALVEPLIRKREQDQGAPVVPYRVPAGMDADAAIRWSKSVYHDESVALEDLPRYLLVLGDLDEVSLELQQAMAGEALVGRLVSRSAAGYAAYVDKLLSSERAPPREARARALFFTAQDGTAATTIGHRALVAPSVARCRDTRQRGGFKARDIEEIGFDGAEAARSALLEQLGRPEPSMLFTMSHGLGAPRRGWTSADEQRAVQGAMSLGSGVRIAAEDLGDRPFLPGGIWFFLACYGGGTPAASAYHHWLARLRDAGGFGGRVDGVLAGLPRPGDRPFIAALPQAALASPRGPLAVMAHIDLAWTYSFQDMGPDGKDRASRFEGVFSSLVKGARVGNSYNELLRYLGNANHELAAMYNQEARAETAGKPLAPDQGRAKRRANLWMLREDLAGYVLLGDPAARLAIDRDGGAVKATPAPAEVRSPLPQLPTAPPAPAAGRARDAARMQRAVHEKILGEEGDRKIAERYGITREELQRWYDAYCEAGLAALGELP